MTTSRPSLNPGIVFNPDKVTELVSTTTTNPINIMPAASYVKDPLASRIRLNRAGLAVDPLKSSIPDTKVTIKNDSSI